MRSFKLYHPEAFQGNLKKKNYFEGWYFKHVSDDLRWSYSFIPGISLATDDPHAFIQIINGTTGITNYVRYSLDDFRWGKNKLYLEIGKSVFTEEFIILNIQDDGLNVTGKIDYSGMIKYPKSLFSPGIMGWYSFVPFMECKHGVISVNHQLTGSITINGELINFDNGKGYIEKDWGTSFPESWIWIQSNNFDIKNASFSLSIAKIPWLGNFFIGLISFLYIKGKFYLFSTYNKSVLSKVTRNSEKINIEIKNSRNVLNVSIMKKSFGELKAPSLGQMSRRIKESIDSEVNVTLYDKFNNLIFEGNGKNAGLEIVDKIFDYL